MPISIVSRLWKCLYILFPANLKISFMIHCTGKSFFEEI